MKFDPFGPGGRELTSEATKQACRIVEAVRNAVGDEIDLVLEFHGRFSPIMALEAIRAMVSVPATLVRGADSGSQS